MASFSIDLKLWQMLGERHMRAQKLGWYRRLLKESDIRKAEREKSASAALYQPSAVHFP